jgi:hypothetical protein
MALLSFVESAPRAYRLKVGNADLFKNSTEPGTSHRERVDLVDRQLQFSRFHRAPDVFPHLVKDLADFLDGAGAEGDADIVDAARGVQVEVEIAMRAAEPADIDDAALDPGGFQILVRDRA